MQELKLADDHDENRWNTFVQTHGTIFHIYQWSRILQSYGYSPRFYLLEKNGEISSILPCVATKTRLVSLPFVDYVAVNSKELVEKVWFSCKAEGLSFEHYSLGEYAIDGLRSDQFAYASDLDLSVGVDVLWVNSFTKKLRNQIRKAEKQGVTVKLVDNHQEYLKEYYELYLRTMRRIGALPHTMNFLKRVFVETKPYVRLFSADLSGRIIGFLLTFVFRDRLHVWGNVSDTRFLWAAPNNLLYFRTIQYAIDKGLCKVDFGSTPLGSGHEHFKDSFGGQQHPIYRISDKPYLPRNNRTISRILISLPHPICQKLLWYIFSRFS